MESRHVPIPATRPGSVPNVLLAKFEPALNWLRIVATGRYRRATGRYRRGPLLHLPCIAPALPAPPLHLGKHNILHFLHPTPQVVTNTIVRGKQSWRLKLNTCNSRGTTLFLLLAGQQGPSGSGISRIKGTPQPHTLQARI